MMTYEILLIIAQLCGSQQHADPSMRLMCAKQMITCYRKPAIHSGPSGSQSALWSSVNEFS